MNMLPVKINQCISNYRNVNTFLILLIYFDYQTLMLQRQWSITNNTLLTLLFLIFVFWTPAAAGPNCYFQKYYTSKILDLKLMVTWKHHTGLLYFDITTIDLYQWSVWFSGCFVRLEQNHVFIIVLWRSYIRFFYILS